MSGGLARSLLAVACVCVLGVLARPVPGSAATLPSGFDDVVVFDGLDQPTEVAFSTDGRVFVAEKAGIIKVFDSLADETPTVFADLRAKVHDYHDRGLTGLALPAGFPATNPYVYVAYPYDGVIGGGFPKWADSCSDPTRSDHGDGCLASARVSRLKTVGSTWTGAEEVLVHDWCGQFPSHTLDTIAFGPDGFLYASAGDGASAHLADYGQIGEANERCPDPPSEGGALRSQDARTSGDPTTLSGTVIRIAPDTGAGVPSNPLFESADANERRLVAYGLRNPFRFDFRPGTDELWVGDVGWNRWEELNRIADVDDKIVENFGWPCYEGASRQSRYDGLDVPLCESLYQVGDLRGVLTTPSFSYRHGASVGETDCPANPQGAISGVAFYATGRYPDNYDGALFFGDYTRQCLWVVFNPSQPQQLSTFARGLGPGAPVSLRTGPRGDLFYVDIFGGAVHRIRYFSDNAPPHAVATATPENGPTPLRVQFDGSSSSDSDGDALAFAWDLDGDGAFDDSTAQRPTRTYESSGIVRVRLRVRDGRGGEDVDSVTITAGGSPPSVTMNSPTATDTWHVGEVITLDGSATDPDQGALPPASLAWTIALHHCATPDSCHVHPLERKDGLATTSFVAPDHDYPAYLTITLTATDTDGLTASVSRRLDPKTIDLEIKSEPAGLRIGLNGDIRPTPYSRRVIARSRTEVSARADQLLNGIVFRFHSWSDGGRAAHAVETTASRTYTASYLREWRGTRGADRLQGTSAPEFLRALAGDDLVLAGGHDDYAYGGRGHDLVRGGSGDDLVVGGRGRDVLRGGPGDDRLVARDGTRDQIACGRGSDVVIADAADRIGRRCEVVDRSRVSP